MKLNEVCFARDWKTSGVFLGKIARGARPSRQARFPAASPSAHRAAHACETHTRARVTGAVRAARAEDASRKYDLCTEHSTSLHRSSIPPLHALA